MEETDPQQMRWMPAFPGAVVGLILTAILFWIGLVVTVAAVGYLVLCAVRRRWDPWAWCGVGVLIGAGVGWLLFLLHALF